MDKKLKEKWLIALRSREYKQGDCYLKSKNLEEKDFLFCCLGVLCDIIDPNGWTNSISSGFSFFWNKDPVFGHEHDYQRLPSKLRNEVKLTEEEETKLIEMNDDGKSFEEIADWIEARL